MLTLDPRQIDRNRLMWRRISRLEALRLCRSHKVAVVQAGALGTGMGESAQWFSLNHPYYRGDGPFAAIREGLRFYLCLDGVPTLARPTNGLAGEKTPGSFDPFDASNYTPLDEPEETKLYPITFELLSPSGKPLPPTPYEITMPDGTKRTGTSGADGFIRYEYNRTPGKAQLKLLPGNAVKPGPGGNGEPAPEIPVQPTPPASPEAPTSTTEVKLVGVDGKPLANRSYLATSPDGKQMEGKSDAQGWIRLTSSVLEGDFQFSLVDVKQDTSET
jgi:hypothetical protein